MIKLQEISSKLGPILNLGELMPRQKTAIDSSTAQQQQTIDSSQKYTEISQDSSLSRETTMASVSRIGLAGADPSRPSTAVATRPQSSTADLKKNFET